MTDIEQGSGATKPSETLDELKTSLNQQTSKITWEELQRFYASGSVIGIKTGMDLIEVACQFSLDNKESVGKWLEDGSVFKVEDQHAKLWYEKKSSHWAVVVAPWVLVQEVNEQTSQ